MELQFTKIGGYYTSNATVNSDFNIHIEKDNPLLITISMSTVEDGQYKTIHTSKQFVIDEDFDAIVYPKYLKITCKSEPTKAILTEAE